MIARAFPRNRDAMSEMQSASADAAWPGALVDVGGLSITTASELLAVLDTADLDAWESVGKVQYALGRRRAADPDQVLDEAAERTGDELIGRHGWHIQPDSPARRTLIQICATLHRLGHDDIVAALDDYADAVEAIVAVDMTLINDQISIAATIERVIVGTILGDGLLSALRQLAQEHTSRPLMQHIRPKRSVGPRSTGRAHTTAKRGR
jgi:hypothetical protein